MKNNALISLVTPDLYIGDLIASRDKDLLQSLGITHILVAATDLAQFYPELDCLDTTSQNIAQFFEEGNLFIQTAIQAGGKVLVHWLGLNSQAGISRSSAVICAYLMYSQKIKSDEALRILKTAHLEADPNTGFMRQLLKYEEILFPDDIRPQEYACRDCREPLFSLSDFEEHTSTRPKRFTKGGMQRYVACSSYFIQQLDWFGNCYEASGSISCPKCHKKLGDYNWGGRQCSCGKYVSPAFQIHHSAIDELSETSQMVSKIYIANPKFS